MATPLPLTSQAVATNGQAPVALSNHVGHVVVSAGVEDALAAVRTAVLLARAFGAAVHLRVSGMDDLEVHFGHARCDALLAGLMDSLRPRLAKLAYGATTGLRVEIALSTVASISIQIHPATETEA